MTSTQACLEEHWMTPREREEIARLAEALDQVFETRGIERNPLLSLRVRELGVLLALTRRLEAHLGAIPAEDAAPDDDKRLAARADAIGKSWERVRKALKELETYIDSHGRGDGASLADEMRPILAKAEGVVEEWLAEQSRQREAPGDADGES